jgi:glycosyltransferase involved in cell wall biosynthesis
MEKPLFNKASGMQALTEAEAEQCRQFGIRVPAVILPNGVDLKAIDTAGGKRDLRRDLRLPPDELLIIFLGRLFPKKGIDLLIGSFAKLASERGNISLVIAGHDAGTGYREELERKAEDAGVGNKTHFIGELRGARKFQALRSADLFALTSHSEGLPVAVLEAMACGLPVMITPGCNIPEILAFAAGWQTGLDVDDIADTLREACGNQGELLRRGRNGRRLVEGRFTWQAIAKKSVAVYEKLCGVDPGE